MFFVILTCMNEWSHRRKTIIFSMVLAILILLIGVPLYFFLDKESTCSDGMQNGIETGVDCGGGCELVCRAEILPVISKGDPRILKIATSSYEVVLELQNPNVSASVLRGVYVFKLWGATGTEPIKIIEGEANIPKGKSFALFEGPFELQEAPIRSTFEWQENSLVWERDVRTDPDVEIVDTLLSGISMSPRLEAALLNESLDRVSNVEVVALVFDPNGTIVAASKTFVEHVDPKKSAPLVFTWPSPFTATTSAVEILPRILPDRSFLR